MTDNDDPAPAGGDDDFVPMVSISDATVREGEGERLVFTVRLTARPFGQVSVDYGSRDVTAVSGEDYLSRSGTLEFGALETEKRIEVEVRDDAHDEGEETMEMVLLAARGSTIGDGVGVGTIVNADPMPGAWLGRFGRAVADGAIEGIAARMDAPRISGMQGGGGGFTFGSADRDAATDSRAWSAADAGPLGIGAAGGFGGGLAAAGLVVGPGQLGGQNPAERSVTLGDLLARSRFAWTGGKDAKGGSLALWSRGSRSSFASAEDTLDLDGGVTTSMLGVDYARNDWLVGVALMQSLGGGGYRGLAGGSPATDGSIETSMTAAIPYASWQTSERLRLWSAAGYGAGKMDLEPQGNDALQTDIGWTMAAAGLKSDLVAVGGAKLALVSDGLWARTVSDRAAGIVATASDVTRLRLGLDARRPLELTGGSGMIPKLELGMRHDSGAAESGFGLEVGAGITWTDPRLGLTLDVDGRTLLSHEDGAMRDRGFSASLAYDPRPDSARGLSLALRQDIGGPSQGGLAALFANEPLMRGADGYGAAGVADQGSWSLEVGYGLATFGRFTGTPHVNYGITDFGRDLSVGWRLASEAGQRATDLSLGVLASRRESNRVPPDHGIGIELRARW